MHEGNIVWQHHLGLTTAEAARLCWRESGVVPSTWSRLDRLLCGSLGCGRGFRKELFEVLEKIRRRVEEDCDLSVDILYRFRLSLVCLEYFEELFVNFRGIGEAVLQTETNIAVRISSERSVYW